MAEKIFDVVIKTLDDKNHIRFYNINDIDVDSIKFKRDQKAKSKPEPKKETKTEPKKETKTKKSKKE